VLSLIRPLILLILSALLLAACGGTPTLAVVPATYDFGEIAADAPVTTTLRVTNVGKGELNISSVATSCGCTTAQLEETTLAPGAATDLTVTFDPQAHPGLYGPLLRMVYLQSNDPAQPEIEVPVHVMILEPNLAPDKES
jgi:hypothetical protein